MDEALILADYLPLSFKGPKAQAIVVEIEAEQTLVNANRELIIRFEQKIQETLASIWGESSPATIPES